MFILYSKAFQSYLVGQQKSITLGWQESHYWLTWSINSLPPLYLLPLTWVQSTIRHSTEKEAFLEERNYQTEAWAKPLTVPLTSYTLSWLYVAVDQFLWLSDHRKSQEKKLLWLYTVDWHGSQGELMSIWQEKERKAVYLQILLNDN